MRSELAKGFMTGGGVAVALVAALVVWRQMAVYAAKKRNAATAAAPSANAAGASYSYLASSGSIGNVFADPYLAPAAEAQWPGVLNKNFSGTQNA